MTIRNPIRTLSPEVARKIAAGEVIERPASVVRELLDNSVDSGASLVSLSVRRPVAIGMLVVATKADRLPRNALRATLEGLPQEFGVDRIARFSARTGEGRDELWREIRSACQPET